jgi:hypothetical protein
MTPDSNDPRRPVIGDVPLSTFHHVERQTYRRRRLIDAVCVLPLLGWILWWLPLIWGQSATPVSASQALIYIFGIWLGLALTAGRLVWLMERTHLNDPPPEVQNP